MYKTGNIEEVSPQVAHKFLTENRGKELLLTWNGELKETEEPAWVIIVAKERFFIVQEHPYHVLYTDPIISVLIREEGEFYTSFLTLLAEGYRMCIEKGEEKLSGIILTLASSCMSVDTVGKSIFNSLSCLLMYLLGKGNFMGMWALKNSLDLMLDLYTDPLFTKKGMTPLTLDQVGEVFEKNFAEREKDEKGN